MNSYTVYRVNNALPEDFQSEITCARMVVYGRHFLENGNEVRTEQYDDDGILISRSEHVYDTAGRETVGREFMDNDTEPFKIKFTEYNEAGKVLSVKCAYGDEEVLSEVYKYDHLGRLVKASFLDEDGNGQSQVWTYEGSCPEPHSLFDYQDETLLREITYKYRLHLGKYELIEQVTDVKEDRYESRIHRFYDIGEVANGVVEETYNADGDFLEEIREIRDVKGNVLQRTWHTDDAEDSFPYEAQTFRYDQWGNIIRDEFQPQRGSTMVNLYTYDSQSRKLRAFHGSNPAVLLLYKYDG